MRIHEFLNHTLELTRQALPPELQGFRSRRRFTLSQLYYGNPRLHFEVWIQGKRRRLEVGLHLEADATTNAHVLKYLADRFIEIQAQTTLPLELEQWTRSWGRIHVYVPYERLDHPLAQMVAERLARMIIVLQPLVEEAIRLGRPEAP